MSEPILEIVVQETAGIDRDREPVTQGIPFPKGRVLESAGLWILDDEGNVVPMAATPLARWVDGSVKWMLLDLQVPLPGRGKKCLRLYAGTIEKRVNEEELAPLVLSENREKISVRTGSIEFEMDSHSLLPFKQITVAGYPALSESLSQIVLTDEHGQVWNPHIDNWTVELQNSLRIVLRFEGSFISGDDTHKLRYCCHIHFFAGKSTARIDFTIWNPCAASHPGGVWDLGDKGSVFFRDLSFELATQKGAQEESHYAIDVGDTVKNVDGNFLIYQDSSGGGNWQSHNHINKNGKIPLSFQGFEVRNDQQVLSRGLRATPCIASSYEGKTIVTTVRHFWQNFPKALELNSDNLNIHLFPKYFNDLFELQGGEQKTHTLYISIQEEAIQNGFLDWVHSPLRLRISPEWYYSSDACSPRPVPPDRVASDTDYSAYQDLIDVAIQGENSFFARREIIDEYGWRNFGEIYADHEAVFHEGAEEFVSHYNNQYDVIKGAILQYMRTGEQEWFRLADEMASHVSDIDIYHTKQDRYEYNNGMFWHTDHHLDAGTSTHRCISQKHREFKDLRFVGGGPAPAHNYTTGFLYHYWLTGDSRSKENVMALAGNIVKHLEGSDIFLERGFTATKSLIKGSLSKIRRQSWVGDYQLDGPGRASGNALNTLLDAFLISSDEEYMRCAERLICRCISPDDNIENRDLLNAEFRWMYNIFLQSLGKYLDIKDDLGELDQTFWYARTVLLKYAEWMAVHEYPYLEKPEILEFPNETWSAQEIRKSDVLAHAARYAPEPLRQRLLEKSHFFFEVCINQLKNDFAETNDLTRVIAILMTNGMVHMDTFSQFTCSEEIASKAVDYMPNAEDVRLQKNKVVEEFKQFVKVFKNTSFKKEIDWLKQRLIK